MIEKVSVYRYCHQSIFKLNNKISNFNWFILSAKRHGNVGIYLVQLYRVVNDEVRSFLVDVSWKPVRALQNMDNDKDLQKLP